MRGACLRKIRAALGLSSRPLSVMCTSQARVIVLAREEGGREGLEEEVREGERERGSLEGREMREQARKEGSKRKGKGQRWSKNALDCLKFKNLW